MELTIWLIISVILIVIWEVFTHVIHEGWMLAPINIFFFLASLTIGSFGYLSVFKKRMGGLSAWVCALVLWFLVFVVLRSILFLS